MGASSRTSRRASAQRAACLVDPHQGFFAQRDDFLERKVMGRGTAQALT